MAFSLFQNVLDTFDKGRKEAESAVKNVQNFFGGIGKSFSESAPGKFLQKYPSPFSFGSTQVSKLPSLIQKVGQTKVPEFIKPILSSAIPRPSLPAIGSSILKNTLPKLIKSDIESQKIIPNAISNYFSPSPNLRVRDVVREVPGAALEITQQIPRDVIGLVLSGQRNQAKMMSGIDPNYTYKGATTFQPRGKVGTFLLGKDPIVPSDESGKQLLTSLGVPEPFASSIGAPTGIALALSNFIGMPEASSKLIAKTENVDEIINLLKPILKTDDVEGLTPLAEQLSTVTKPKDVVSKIHEFRDSLLKQPQAINPPIDNRVRNQFQKNLTAQLEAKNPEAAKIIADTNFDDAISSVDLARKAFNSLPDNLRQDNAVKQAIHSWAKSGEQTIGFIDDSSGVSKLSKDLPTTKIEVLPKSNNTHSSEIGKFISDIYSNTEKGAEIDSILNNSEAGYRVHTGYGSDLNVQGIPSSFPDFLPQGSRTKKIVTKVLEHLRNGTTPKEKDVNIYSAYKSVVHELTGKKFDDILKNITNKDLSIAERIPEKVQVKNAIKAGEAPHEIIDTAPSTAKKVSKELEQKVQAVSDKVGEDVSLEKTIAKSATNVKDKVNLLDQIRTPEHVMKKIGMKKEMDLIRTQFDKYIKELPEEVMTVRKWSEKTTPLENQNIFDYLDGQKIELSKKEQGIANQVKLYLKEWADKLNLPQDNRISNYITHIFDKDFIGKEFPEEMAKIIDDKVAGSVYDPFTLKRLGAKGYKRDTWLALEAYVKRATRKYNMDPALEQVKLASKNLELSQFKYVKNYIDRINLRPTEIDTMMDNTIKSIIGYKLGQRPVAALSRSARGIIYRGALGLNVSSALKNLSQGANTYAKLGEKYTIIGYSKLLKNWSSKELEQVGVLADSFIQDKNLSVYKKTLEKIDKVLFYLFEKAEKINRGAAYYGAKSKYISEHTTKLGKMSAVVEKNLEENAIKYAKKIVRETQFSFGAIDTPPILQSDIGKTLGQFQSFTLKQGEFLAGMAKNKEYAGLVRYIVASLLFVYTIGKSFGMSPKDLIPMFRIGTPPTLALPVTTAKAIAGAPNKYGQPTGISDITQAAVPIIPAGVQLKKSYEGINAVLKGKSETTGGKVRFNVPQTPFSFIQGGLFGQYASPKAQKFFDSGRGAASSDTVNARELYDTIKAGKTREDRIKLLNEAVSSGKINDKNVTEFASYFKDESTNITDNEKTIRSKSVDERAQWSANEIQKGKTKEEKIAKLDELVAKGILTDSVIKKLPTYLSK